MSDQTDFNDVAENEQTGAQDPEIARLKEALAQAEARAVENLQLAQRTRADAENLRRRMEKDMDNARKFGIERLVGELVPVLDSMELSLQAATDNNADLAKFVEGSQLTHRMLLSAMEKYGVKAIDPMGEKFNPALHQAMTMQEKAGVEPNTVIAVLQKGFVLNERIVRPAMVIVSKESSAPGNHPKIDETA